MGQRGPKGKPAELKRLEGNPGNRPLPEDCVEPVGPVVRPAHVRDYAATVWDRVIGAMPSGVYKSTDAETLAAYCLACARLQEATEMLALQGNVIAPSRTYVDEDGEDVTIVGKAYRNPWGVIAREATQEIATLGTRLGLDPKARETIRAPKAPTASKFAGLVGIIGGKASA